MTDRHDNESSSNAADVLTDWDARWAVAKRGATAGAQLVGYFDTPARLDMLQAAIQELGGGALCKTAEAEDVVPKGYRGTWCGVPLWDAPHETNMFVFQPAGTR